MLPTGRWMTFLFDLHTFGSFCSQTGHNGQQRAMRLAAPARLDRTRRWRRSAGMLTKPQGAQPRVIHPTKKKLEPNQNSQHMAVKCKYPAFAKTSWPPSLRCNRLWKDGAKCLGIMLVLCDKAGCFYYKPTIVKQRLKKNSNISCLHLFSTQRINSCRSGPGENTSIYSHDALSHHFLLFYCPWTTGVSVSACFLRGGWGKEITSGM